MDGDEGDVSDEDEAADLEDEQIKQEVSRKSRKKHQRLAKELSDCVTICQSVSFKDFKHSKKSCKSLCGDTVSQWFPCSMWQVHQEATGLSRVQHYFIYV